MHYQITGEPDTSDTPLQSHGLGHFLSPTSDPPFHTELVGYDQERFSFVLFLFSGYPYLLSHIPDRLFIFFYGLLRH